MASREKWTDEQLNEAFTRLDGEVRGLRSEIQDLRTEIHTRFDALQGRMEIRFDQQLYMLIVAVLVITIVFASN
jgi:hypothetical protein